MTMSTETTLDNIPTLTQVVHQGDESMENHFSANLFDDVASTTEEPFYFDDDNGIDNEPVEYNLQQNYDSTKKQEPFIDNEIDTPKSFDEADDLITSLDENIATNEPITIPKENFEEKELRKAVDAIINDAVKNIMPEIEQKLTRSLSQKIYQKLFNHNSSK